MGKRAGLLLAGAFIFFYLLNYLMPLAFGDDYIYAFIWQGKPMFLPLKEGAVKISSLQDLIASQISFYFTWSGRVVNNTLSQLFIWVGKDVFNVFNAFASVILVLEIYWCANKGKITFSFDIFRLAWLFLLFWVFTPGFPSVVLWLVGACHYLWTAVLLTGFLIPYIRKYYCLEKQVVDNCWFSLIMLVSGVLAGCTNENSVCWIVLLLLAFIASNRKNPSFEGWMYTGVFGLVLGYAILMLSPGNIVRLQATHDAGWFNVGKVLENMHIFSAVLVIQFLLWYFCIRSLPKIFKNLYACTIRCELIKELLLIKAFCTTAMGMTFVMMFSPEFYLRSAFPGTVQLIIVIGIILRIESEYGIVLLRNNAKQFLTCVGIISFVVSAGFTLDHLYKHHVYNEKILLQVEALKKEGNIANVILVVESFPKASKVSEFLSGYHTFDNNFSDDADSWTNVSFARYYGIKGIRVLGASGKTKETRNSN